MVFDAGMNIEVVADDIATTGNFWLVAGNHCKIILSFFSKRKFNKIKEEKNAEEAKKKVIIFLKK